MKHLLIDLRHYLELTQQEMADLLGISKQTVSSYEIGRRKPHPTIALRYMQIAQMHGRKLNLEWWIE